MRMTSFSVLSAAFEFAFSHFSHVERFIATRSGQSNVSELKDTSHLLVVFSTDMDCVMDSLQHTVTHCLMSQMTVANSFIPQIPVPSASSSSTAAAAHDQSEANCVLESVATAVAGQALASASPQQIQDDGYTGTLHSPLPPLPREDPPSPPPPPPLPPIMPSTPPSEANLCTKNDPEDLMKLGSVLARACDQNNQQPASDSSVRRMRGSSSTLSPDCLSATSRSSVLSLNASAELEVSRQKPCEPQASLSAVTKERLSFPRLGKLSRRLTEKSNSLPVLKRKGSYGSEAIPLEEPPQRLMSHGESSPTISSSSKGLGRLTDCLSQHQSSSDVELQVENREEISPSGSASDSSVLMHTSGSECSPLCFAWDSKSQKCPLLSLPPSSCSHNDRSDEEESSSSSCSEISEMSSSSNSSSAADVMSSFRDLSACRKPTSSPACVSHFNFRRPSEPAQKSSSSPRGLDLGACEQEDHESIPMDLGSPVNFSVSHLVDESLTDSLVATPAQSMECVKKMDEATAGCSKGCEISTEYEEDLHDLFQAQNIMVLECDPSAVPSLVSSPVDSEVDEAVANSTPTDIRTDSPLLSVCSAEDQDQFPICSQYDGRTSLSSPKAEKHLLISFDELIENSLESPSMDRSVLSLRRVCRENLGLMSTSEALTNVADDCGRRFSLALSRCLTVPPPEPARPFEPITFGKELTSSVDGCSSYQFFIHGVPGDPACVKAKVRSLRNFSTVYPRLASGVMFPCAVPHFLYCFLPAFCRTISLTQVWNNM